MAKENVMSSRTRVSKQVKVTQGKEAITFELSPKGLVISYGEIHTEQQTVATEATRFTLKQPGIDALIDLLALELIKEVKVPKATTPLPGSDEIERRLTREPATPDRPMTEEEGSGLTSSPGEAEAGMD